MQARTWGTAGLLVLASSVGSVQAQLIGYEFRGTVADLTDTVGIFGSPASGTPFTLTYLGDFSKGQLNGGGGGFGSGIWLSGGAAYDAQPGWPTLQISPISAVLEINGRSLDFAGTDAGFMGYAKNWYDDGYEVTGHSLASFYAYTVDPSDGSLITAIDSSIQTDELTTFGALDDPIRLAIGGTTYARTSFSYLWAAGTDHATLITGDLMPELYTAAPAIPEPGTWAMLGAGLLALGAVSRRRSTLAFR